MKAMGLGMRRLIGGITVVLALLLIAGALSESSFVALLGALLT